jgi:hypothetical protein
LVGTRYQGGGLYPGQNIRASWAAQAGGFFPEIKQAEFLVTPI